MPALNDLAETAREQVTEYLATAERISLAWLDVNKSAALFTVPVAVAAAPNKDELIERLDSVIENLYDAAGRAVTAGYAAAGRAAASAPGALLTAA